MLDENIKNRGLLLVLSSPSGAGKTTLSRRLLETDNRLTMSISMTTRSPRPGEIDGQDYIFVDESEFERRIKAGDFLEHAKVFDNHYGTPKNFVESALEQGRDILFDIDWQGTQQLVELVPNDIVKVFILPPTWEALEERLKKRAQDSDEIVKHRMSKAADEITHWSEYDYVLINDDIVKTQGQIETILSAERIKRQRQVGLSSFVGKLTAKHIESGKKS